MQGAERGYIFEFDGDGNVSLIKKHNGKEVLKTAPYQWQLNKKYKLHVTAKGRRLNMYINDEPIMEADDCTFAYGMPALYIGKQSECLFHSLHVKTYE